METDRHAKGPSMEGSPFSLTDAEMAVR